MLLRAFLIVTMAAGRASTATNQEHRKSLAATADEFSGGTRVPRAVCQAGRDIVMIRSRTLTLVVVGIGALVAGVLLLSTLLSPGGRDLGGSHDSLPAQGPQESVPSAPSHGAGGVRARGDAASADVGVADALIAELPGVFDAGGQGHTPGGAGTGEGLAPDQLERAVIREQMRDAADSGLMKMLTRITGADEEEKALILEVLLDELEWNEDSRVRTVCATCLGSFAGEEDAVAGLVLALRSDRAREVRLWAARSLGRIGGERVLEPLLEALSVEDRLRAVLIHILGRDGREIVQFKHVKASEMEPFIRH